MTNPNDQPLELKNGIVRFRANAVVCALLEGAREAGFDLNDLARSAYGAPRADWEQFYQLIGYSLPGYHELSNVSDAACERATLQAKAQSLLKVAERGGCRDDGCPIHKGVPEERT